MELTARLAFNSRRLHLARAPGESNALSDHSESKGSHTGQRASYCDAASNGMPLPAVQLLLLGVSAWCFNEVSVCGTEIRRRLFS